MWLKLNSSKTKLVENWNWQTRKLAKMEFGEFFQRIPSFFAKFHRYLPTGSKVQFNDFFSDISQNWRSGIFLRSLTPKLGWYQFLSPIHTSQIWLHSDYRSSLNRVTLNDFIKKTQKLMLQTVKNPINLISLVSRFLWYQNVWRRISCYLKC